MITKKTFKIWNGTIISEIIFLILEGLQQGTINSPKLFSILSRGVLLLFRHNGQLKKYAIAYADDLKVMAAHKNPTVVQDELEIMLDELNTHYHDWNLRINPDKCETILYHQPQNKLNSNKRLAIKHFSINFTNKENHRVHKIKHKKTVKYLGVHLDYLLRLNDHVTIQLKKASDTHKKYARLMHTKDIEPRAKGILYMLLVRPVLTYAAPIWWNVSATTMEKLRRFERSCLRSAFSIYRDPENPKKMISNEVLYRTANIPRIDNFILKITRDYLAQLKKIKNKEIIELTKQMNEYPQRAQSGYFPPPLLYLC